MDNYINNEETLPWNIKALISLMVRWSVLALAVNLAIVSYLVYVLVSTPPAVGYELSIYNAYPLGFWVAFLALYLFNILLIFLVRDKRASLIALVGILISTIILALLPLQRDYFSISGGDSLSHLTYVNNLISEGKLGLSPGYTDPYPLPHLLTGGLVLVGLSSSDVIQIVPILYYVWYIVFLYLLARQLFKDSQLITTLMLLALLPILSIHLYYPSLFFLYLLPSLLYFMLKRWWVPAVVMAIALPFSHPASSLYLLTILLIAGIIYHAQGHHLNSKAYWAISGIFLVTWVVWLFVLKPQLVSVATTTPAIILGLSDDSPPSQFRDIMRGIALANMNFGELFLLYIKRYGQLHLIMGLGIIGSATMLYRWATHKAKEYSGILAVQILCLLYSGAYLASFFTSPTIILNRVSPYALVLAILPASILIHKLIKTHRVYIVLIVMLLFSTNYFAVFTQYNSLFNRHPPQQITMSEVDAIRWLLDNKEAGIEVYDLLRKQRRMAAYILGHEYTKNKNTDDLDAAGLPFHFGYDEYETLGEALGKDGYLLTNEKNIDISTKMYPEYEDIWAYHPDDYAKLENDASLSLVYKDNGIRVYRVRGREE